ncbi:hypothetical protein [Salegentibacter sp. UBA1130]|uniref:hypothetical protein n=1 Tax=Salegentibacter sp. UBA1130 TaxID=1947451 RepID=UPI00257DD0EF|nr:hypothetical protein [Salegentibacter sp. UBA1130]
MKRIILLLTIIFALGACSDEEKEAELDNRISELETQLDECKNGSDKLLAKVKIAFEEENFEEVKTIYSDFQNRHPESPEFKEAESINDQVTEIEEKRKKEAERIAEEKRKEAERIAAKEKADKLKALNKLRKNYDDVSGITWYKQPYFTHYTNTNLTSIYMGENGTNRWLRLQMTYKGDDWIFFERAYLSYDGNTKEIVFNKYDDKETDHSGGGVWEWIDLTVTKDVEMFLREFAESNSAKMRLTGKYTKTRTLTYNERRGILDVLNGYDAIEQGIK